MSDQPRYHYISTASLASRRNIEESYYGTTPNVTAETTPFCGQAVSAKVTVDLADVKDVDRALRRHQALENQGAGRSSSEPPAKGRYETWVFNPDDGGDTDRTERQAAASQE
ncbi:hypothetical protein BBP40_010423 [Aspergillus hancockii]|nr:hypothetical protein BBP40_010423 [Aspergillus hancockii]